MQTEVFCQIFDYQHELEEAWLTPPSIPEIAKDLIEEKGYSVETQFASAVHMVYGALYSRGYTLFRNGGLPQLIKLDGPWRCELLFKQGPNSVPGLYVPAQIMVHISLESLRELRQKYWRGSNLPSISVCSGNSGTFEPKVEDLEDFGLYRTTYCMYNFAIESKLDRLVQNLIGIDEVFEKIMMTPMENFLEKRGENTAIAHLLEPSVMLEISMIQEGRAKTINLLNALLFDKHLNEQHFKLALQSLSQIDPKPLARMDQSIRELAAARVAYSLDLCRRWLF